MARLRAVDMRPLRRCRKKKRPLMRMAQAGTFQIQGLPLCRGVAGIVEVFGIRGDLSAFLGDGRGFGA